MVNYPITMNALQTRIHNMAAHNHLKLVANILKQDDMVIKYTDATLVADLKTLLPKLYPDDFGVKGEINGIETFGKPIPKGNYYPEGSMYHIGIIYSGRYDTKEHFFRNMTAHYDENMKFISLQRHHNQPEHNWREISVGIEDIFRRITL